MGYNDEYEYVDDDEYYDDDDENYIDYTEDGSDDASGGGERRSAFSSSSSAFSGGGLPGGGSRFGSGSAFSNRFADDEDSEADDGDDESASSSPFSSRFGGSAGSSSRFPNRFGASGGSDEADDGDDESASSSPFSSRFGGSAGSSSRFSSRFGASGDAADDRGDKQEAESAAEKPTTTSDESTNRFGIRRPSATSAEESSSLRFSTSRISSSKSDNSEESAAPSASSAASPTDEQPASAASGGGSRFGSRFGGGSKPDDPSAASSPSQSADAQSAPPASGGGSRFGGGPKPDDPSAASSPSQSADAQSAPPASGGGSRFGSRFGGGSKPDNSDKSAADNKPDEKKDENSSGLAKRPSSGEDKTDKQPAAKQDDAADNSGGFLSSIGSRFGGGDKTSEKKDDKADAPKEDSGGGIGGFVARLGGGGGDKKADAPSVANESAGKQDNQKGQPATTKKSSEKKDGKKSAETANKKASGERSTKEGGGLMDRMRGVGNLLPGLGGGKEDEGQKKPAPVKASGKSSGAKVGKKAASSSKSSDKKGSQSSKSGKSSSKKDKEAESSNPLGQIAAVVGGIFGGADDNKKSSKSGKSSKKTAASKVPTTTDDGLTLDQWLDIAGVVLVFSSFVLFFSAISRDQAAISNVHNLLGEVFGWGALAVPISLFVIGFWLIVRHFGDEAPTVDPIRVAGVILGFVAVLVIFQYVDSFNYDDVMLADGTVPEFLLRERLRFSWDNQQAGGGIIGAEIYFFLVTTVTEIGGFVIVLFTLLISMMLITRLSAAEILAAVAGMSMQFRDWMRERARERRAARQLAAQQSAERMAARRQQQGQGEMVAATAGAGNESPPTLPTENREIRFNRGNNFNTGHQTMQAQAAPSTAQNLPPPPVSTNHNNDSSSGLFSRFRKNSNGGNTAGYAAPPITLPETPLPMDDGFSHFDNGLPASPAAYNPPPQTAPPPQPRATSVDDDAGAVATAPQPPASAEDEQRRARQERLNALRSGKSGPLSELGQAAPANEAEQPGAGRPTNNDIRVGPDRVTGPQEFNPSQLPSAQPGTGTEPYQSRLAIEPNQPVSSEVRSTKQRPAWSVPDYRGLLSTGSNQEFDREYLLSQAKTIEDTLQGFGAPGRVVEVNTGPVVTQFGVEPDYLEGRGGKKQRVKVSAIAALDKDLQLALGARSIRVEAPVPGKGYVGIEVPNAEATMVSLRDVMDSNEFQKINSPLAIALGQSVSGAPVSADLSEMPHLLIAGTTGSGKSVCVNSIIASIISRNPPDRVKLIMVDPKRVELTGYNGIPHLVAPVVVELERIVGVLKWVTREMDSRYKKFSDAGARNIEDYNSHRDPSVDDPMPYMVVIIDELADLMMMAPEDTERAITRIAALARATGIHLVIATQRPSVDVVTGLIKANFPARIAFAVAGGVDSRVILDQPGAERLLGKGDMLYLSGKSPAPLRMQGVFVSDMEINNIVRYWKMQAIEQPEPRTLTIAPKFKPSPEVQQTIQQNRESSYQQPMFDDSDDEEDTNLTQGELTGNVKEGNEDELYEKAVELVRKLDKASISLLQRRLRIGYTRAARLIDLMEARNVVGPAKEGSSKPRDVLPPSVAS